MNRSMDVTVDQPNEEWDMLSDAVKNKLIKSMEQGDAGLVTPASEVIQSVREKYNLSSQAKVQ